jgi:hypothetical protein
MTGLNVVLFGRLQLKNDLVIVAMIPKLIPHFM